MKKNKRTLAIVFALVLVNAGFAAAQSASRPTAKPRAADTSSDPFVGVWSLNPAKSKFESGSAPKGFVRNYEDRGGGVMMMMIEVTGDRGVTRSYLTYKRDGKDYPEAAVGVETVRFVSVRALDPRTEEVSAGNVKLTLTVAPDGKTITQTQSGTTSQGKPFTNTVIYDKQ